MKPNKTINTSQFRVTRSIQNDKYKHDILFNEQNSKTCLQIIFNKKCESQEEEANFMHNFSHISQISTHPSLLHIIDYNINDSNNPLPFIITENLQNGTISEFLQNCSKTDFNKLTSTKKLINFIGIASGIQFIYLNLINFGNLKSSNIYLDDNLYPHILIYENMKENNDCFNPIKRIQSQSNDLFNFSKIVYEMITEKTLENSNTLPDFSFIKSEWLRSFLQNCLLDDCYEKPKFNKIFKHIIYNRKLYQTEFGQFIDEEEVTQYLKSIELYYSNYLRELKEKVKIGDSDSIYILGNMLYWGIGIDENKEESAKMFQIASDQGNPEAMFSYGVMLANGEGITKDKTKAIEYYSKSANLGHPFSINNYALLIENGEGIEMDKEKAIQMYKEAASNGITISMCNYALMRKNEEGFIDKNEALNYYKMAADHGNRQGLYNYGLMLAEGNGVNKKFEEGMKYIKMAADKGYTTAMLKYGVLLFQNDKEHLHYDEIAKYFKMAAESGDQNGMYVYGVMLKNGEGVKMDKNSAFSYFKKAGYLGHVKAWRLYNLMSNHLNYSL